MLLEVFAAPGPARRSALCGGRGVGLGEALRPHPLDSEHAECEGVSNTITQLRFLVFCFSVTSLLGQWGQICFAEYLKIVNKFFA